MHPRPTANVSSDYPNTNGNLIDAIDRRLKGNLADNGAFQVWQKGTSFAAPAGFATGPDRWVVYRNGFAAGATFSRQTGGDAQYCLRVQRDVGNASTATISAGQALESIDSIALRGKRITATFRARCGANFSGSGSTMTLQMISGLGSDETVYGFTGGASIGSVTPALTTSWQEFTATSTTISASATQIGWNLTFLPTGVAGAADYFEVELVQVVVGEYGGEFPYKPYSEELARCRRFLPAYAGPSSTLGQGFARLTTQAYIPVPFGVQPRVAPTGVTVSSGAHFTLSDGVAAAVASTTVVLAAATLYAGVLDVGVAAGLTQYRPYLMTFNNASASILFTGAEI